MSGPGEAGGVPGYLLWRVANMWQKRMRAVLAPFGVTPVQYLLLAALAEALETGDGAVKQSALSRATGADAMMTSQVLRALEKAGLVVRTAHEGDGRAIAVTLAEAGLDLVARAAGPVAAADAAFHAPLGADAPAFADALRLLTGVRPRRRVKAISG